MSEHSLWVIITATTLGSSVLVIVTGLAYLRRRTWSYLLIAVAIGMLTIRSLVGLLSIAGPLQVETHHELEHLLDVAAIGLLFAAIYFAHTVSVGRSVDEPQNSTTRDE